MNESNEVEDLTTFTCTLYITLGFLSTFCNILNLTIWLSNRELRQKYIYLMALDICELVDAISYILVGTGRILALSRNHLWTPITMRKCFFKTYWTHSLILGTQLPSFAIILISCERLCAVLRPADYNRIFRGYTKLALLTMVPIAGMLSLTVGGLSTIGEAGDEEFPSQHCTISTSTATCISFIAIVVVRRISKKHSKGKFGGDNRFGAMLIITGSSVILVGSEPFVQLLIRWDLASFGEFVFAGTHAMPACLSIFNTIVNFIFRPDFRNQFLVLLSIRHSTYGQSVRPVTIVVQPQQIPSSR